MKEFLQKAFSESTLNLLPSLRSKLSPHCFPPPLSSLSSRLFSSKIPDPESNLGQSQKSQKKDGENRDEGKSSLREQMDKLLEGDQQAFKEAFPTVFEGLMEKILVGKSEEEIRKELLGHRDSDAN